MKTGLDNLSHSKTPQSKVERLQIKVCGMRDSANIRSLLTLKPDFIGFIFYEKSKRYVGSHLDANIINAIPSTTKKVGVFVDSPEKEVLEAVVKYKLDYVQLHGNESIEYCKSLNRNGIKIIKAISITNVFDFGNLLIFEGIIDFFLFDTATPQKGGSGIVFDWLILERYKGTIPFFLAGGIDEFNINEAKKLKHKQLYALDLNSKFEIEPGIKDTAKLKQTLS